MPNWCSNNVTFLKGDLRGLAALLEAGKQVMQKENRGWLPPEVEERDLRRYLFELEIDLKENYLHVMFESKWAPPIDEIAMIANMFGCAAVMAYDECGNGVYGQCTYTPENGLVDVYLDQAEIDLVVYDEETCKYTFEGEVYDSDYECYEILLERKMEGGKA